MVLFIFSTKLLQVDFGFSPCIITVNHCY